MPKSLDALNATPNSYNPGGGNAYDQFRSNTQNTYNKFNQKYGMNNNNSNSYVKTGIASVITPPKGGITIRNLSNNREPQINQHEEEQIFKELKASQNQPPPKPIIKNPVTG